MLEQALHFINQKILGIFLYQYLLAFLFLTGGFFLKRMSEWGLERLRLAAQKTRFKYDDIVLETLKGPVPFLFVILGVYLAAHSLPVPTQPLDIRRFLNACLRAGSILLAMWAALRLLNAVTAEWIKAAKRTDSKIDDHLIPIVRQASKVFLYMVGGLLILQNLGYSVGSLLAGFGLGGAALALAAKDSLSNLFGSIVIFMDRPFRVGDWIEMGGVEGTVEEIGLRTTKVRTFANSLITMPNSSFTTTAINNWSRMRKRRIKFTVGLTYSTSADHMQRAVERIRQIIREDPDLHHDFFLVNFDAFSSSSLDIFIYCFTKTIQWADFLDAKQKLMLNIMRAVEEMGLEFAFPTRTLHVVPPTDKEKALH